MALSQNRLRIHPRVRKRIRESIESKKEPHPFTDFRRIVSDFNAGVDALASEYEEVSSDDKRKQAVEWLKYKADRLLTHIDQDMSSKVKTPRGIYARDFKGLVDALERVFEVVDSNSLKLIPLNLAMLSDLVGKLDNSHFNSYAEDLEGIFDSWMNKDGDLDDVDMDDVKEVAKRWVDNPDSMNTGGIDVEQLIKMLASKAMPVLNMSIVLMIVFQLLASSSGSSTVKAIEFNDDSVPVQPVSQQDERELIVVVPGTPYNFRNAEVIWGDKASQITSLANQRIVEHGLEIDPNSEIILYGDGYNYFMLSNGNGEFYKFSIAREGASSEDLKDVSFLETVTLESPPSSVFAAGETGVILFLFDDSSGEFELKSLDPNEPLDPDSEFDNRISTVLELDDFAGSIRIGDSVYLISNSDEEGTTFRAIQLNSRGILEYPIGENNNSAHLVSSEITLVGDGSEYFIANVNGTLTKYLIEDGTISIFEEMDLPLSFGGSLPDLISAPITDGFAYFIKFLPDGSVLINLLNPNETGPDKFSEMVLESSSYSINSEGSVVILVGEGADRVGFELTRASEISANGVPFREVPSDDLERLTEIRVEATGIISETAQDSDNTLEEEVIGDPPEEEPSSEVVIDEALGENTLAQLLQEGERLPFGGGENYFLIESPDGYYKFRVLEDSSEFLSIIPFPTPSEEANLSEVFIPDESGNIYLIYIKDNGDTVIYTFDSNTDSYIESQIPHYIGHVEVNSNFYFISGIGEFDGAFTDIQLNKNDDGEIIRARVTNAFMLTNMPSIKDQLPQLDSIIGQTIEEFGNSRVIAHPQTDNVYVQHDRSDPNQAPVEVPGMIFSEVISIIPVGRDSASSNAFSFLFVQSHPNLGTWNVRTASQNTDQSGYTFTNISIAHLGYSELEGAPPFEDVFNVEYSSAVGGYIVISAIHEGDSASRNKRIYVIDPTTGDSNFIEAFENGVVAAPGTVRVEVGNTITLQFLGGSVVLNPSDIVLSTESRIRIAPSGPINSSLESTTTTNSRASLLGEVPSTNEASQTRIELAQVPHIEVNPTVRNTTYLPYYSAPGTSHNFGQAFNATQGELTAIGQIGNWIMIQQDAPGGIQYGFVDEDLVEVAFQGDNLENLEDVSRISFPQTETLERSPFLYELDTAGQRMRIRSDEYISENNMERIQVVLDLNGVVHQGGTDINAEAYLERPATLHLTAGDGRDIYDPGGSYFAINTGTYNYFPMTGRWTTENMLAQTNGSAYTYIALLPSRHTYSSRGGTKVYLAVLAHEFSHALQRSFGHGSEYSDIMGIIINSMLVENDYNSLPSNATVNRRHVVVGDGEQADREELVVDIKDYITEDVYNHFMNRLNSMQAD